MERLGTQNAESARIRELIGSVSCLRAYVGLEGTLHGAAFGQGLWAARLCY